MSRIVTSREEDLLLRLTLPEDRVREYLQEAAVGRVNKDLKKIWSAYTEIRDQAEIALRSIETFLGEEGKCEEN